jgi:hypothetical protein
MRAAGCLSCAASMDRDSSCPTPSGATTRRKRTVTITRHDILVYWMPSGPCPVWGPDVAEPKAGKAEPSGEGASEPVVRHPVRKQAVRRLSGK